MKKYKNQLYVFNLFLIIAILHIESTASAMNKISRSSAAKALVFSTVAATPTINSSISDKKITPPSWKMPDFVSKKIWPAQEESRALKNKKPTPPSVNMQDSIKDFLATHSEFNPLNGLATFIAIGLGVKKLFYSDDTEKENHFKKTSEPWTTRLWNMISPPQETGIEYRFSDQAAIDHFVTTGECQMCDLSKLDLVNVIKAAQKIATAQGTVMNLSGANFKGAYLPNVDLRNAILSGADFSNAHMDGADLRDAIADNGIFKDTILNNATLNGASLKNVILDGASLINATLNKADATGASLRWTKLNNASLYDTILNGANATGANFQYAKLIKAQFIKAICIGTNFTLSDVYKTNFSQANRTGADFTQSVDYEFAIFN